MALINVNRKDPRVETVLANMPEGKWDVVQFDGNGLVLLLVHHDVRDRLGVRIHDIICKMPNGHTIIMETVWSWGWKTGKCMESGAQGDMLKDWYLPHLKGLGECKVICMRWPEVVLRYESSYVVKNHQIMGNNAQ